MNDYEMDEIVQRDFAARVDRRGPFPFASIGIWVRPRHVLKNHSIYTVSTLITKTPFELTAWKGFGKESLRNVREALATERLHLKDDGDWLRAYAVDCGDKFGSKPTVPNRFFFDRDCAGHWYMVRTNFRAEWQSWMAIDTEDERRWKIPPYATPINTGPQFIEFENPKEWRPTT